MSSFISPKRRVLIGGLSALTAFVFSVGAALAVSTIGTNIATDGTFTVNGNSTIGDAGADTVTANAAAWTFANDTTVALSGGVDGINFDSSTLSIDATNNRIGLLDASPAATLTVGAGDLFQVNSSGDVVRIDNVTYDWPGSQGGAATVLTNDGAGALSWTAASATTTLQQAYDNDANGSDVTVTTNATDGAIVLAGDQQFRVTTTGSSIFDTSTLVVDAANNRVGILDASPTAALTVGSGDLFTVDSSGNVATSGTINGLTLTTTTGTFTLTNGKTLAATNSLTLSGTDGTVMTFPSTTATLARTDAGQTFTGVNTFTSPSVTTSLTTGSTTFALLNDTATTVNAFGAATTLNIGASAATVLNLGGAAASAELRFLEPSASGTNYSAFKAQAQGASVTYTLPAAVGASGAVLTDAAGNGTLSWAVPTGFVNGGNSFGGTATLGTNDTQSLAFETDGTTQMTLTSGGDLGLGASPTAGKLVVAQGTVTTDLNALNLTSTWNAAGVAFTGIELNVTNTASAAASLLMDLQVGGTSQFSVGRAGAVTALGAFNKVTITPPATGATLTLADGSTLATAGANSVTLTSTGATNVTLPTTGTLATLAGSEALTNKTYNGLTLTSTTGTLTLTNGKTLAATNSLTLSGTDGTAMTFPSTTATLARTDAGQTFTGVNTFTSPSVTTSLTTGSTTFGLLSSTATTINFAGASGAVVNLGGGVAAAELRFLEPSGSGVNFSAFKAQAQGADVTYTLPAAVGASGAVLTDAAGNGTLSWAVPAGSGDMVLASIQTVTGLKTFGTPGGAVDKLAVAGGTSGSTIIAATAIAGSGTVTLPTTGTLATLAGSETFTNKTLTSPQVGTAILDTSGNELIKLTATGSAVNELGVTNAATGASPTLGATGDDADVGINFQGKGTGTFRFLSTASQAAEFRLLEDTDDGANYTAFKPQAQGANITYTLPATVGGAGTVLTDAAGNGTLSWAVPAGSGDMVLSSIQVVTGLKTFGTAGGAVDKLAVAGATSGSTIIAATPVAGSGTVTLPTTGTLATLAGSETFTNKTLTSPRVGTSLLDTSGNELIVLTATGSAVNEVTLANAATGGNPTLTASGDDANIGLNFQGKGTGTFRFLGTASQAAELRILEDTDDGTNYTALKIGTQAGDLTITLPATAGSDTNVLRTNGAGVTSWGAVAASEVTNNSDVVGTGLAAAINNVASQQRVFRPVLPFIGSALTPTTGRTYCTYLTYLPVAKTIKHVEFFVATAGAGAQTAEVALASTPLAPNKATQTVTVLAADGTLTDLTVGAALKRNTTAFSAGAGYAVAAGTHLWACLRTAMATTQPALLGVPGDFLQGQVLVADSVGALTSATTFSGTVVNSGASTVVGGYLNATMD